MFLVGIGVPRWGGYSKEVVAEMRAFVRSEDHEELCRGIGRFHALAGVEFHGSVVAGRAWTELLGVPATEGPCRGPPYRQLDGAGAAPSAHTLLVLFVDAPLSTAGPVLRRWNMAAATSIRATTSRPTMPARMIFAVLDDPPPMASYWAAAR